MNFEKLYRSKVTDLDTALSYVKSGSGSIWAAARACPSN